MNFLTLYYFFLTDKISTRTLHEKVFSIGNFLELIILNRMLIAVAGPYTAGTEEQKKKNLDAMNEAASRVYKKGHIPVIGVNTAFFVLEKLTGENKNKAMMDIALAIVDRCDALLLIGNSPGANKERDVILSKGKQVFYSIDEIPEGNLV